MRSVAVLCVLLIATSLLVSGWALYSRSSAAAQAHRENIAAWHKVICYSEQVIRQAHLPKEKERQAIKFYDQILVIVGAEPCSADH